VRYTDGEFFYPRGIALEIYTEPGDERALRLYISFFRWPRSKNTHPMESPRFIVPVGGYFSCVESIKHHVVQTIQPWAQVSEEEVWVAAYVPIYGVDGQIVAELNTRDLQNEFDGIEKREAVVIPFRSRTERDEEDNERGTPGSGTGPGDGEVPSVPPNKSH
jgi:hypothetical protein